VGWEAVRVDTAGGVLSVLPGTAIDLDGVAKGYAVDRATAALERMGVESGVVDAGGDVGFAGASPDPAGWRVGIKHPRRDGLLGVLRLDGGGVATSGDYQRCVFVDGVRYHHILDPGTGHPAGGMMSVTVCASRCMDADALATAVFVMGAERGMALVERTPGVEALVVTSDGDAMGEVLLSTGLVGRFEEYDEEDR
jgi:thiamine biosynthesis lipoprotein